MGYYPILDRTPKGREEDDGFPALDPAPRRVRRPLRNHTTPSPRWSDGSLRDYAYLNWTLAL